MTPISMQTSSCGEVVRISSVTKKFGGASGVLALDSVSLTVKTGEFVSIVGPSGCGKSTLLYMLAGFMNPDDGELTVNGATIHGPGIDRGIVFQEYALFPWLTVYDNIAFGLIQKKVAAEEIRRIVAHFLSKVGLNGFEHRYPRELSGGMKQRVALARTFAYQPDVLLLDEPFGALDAQTREFMQDELLGLWKETNKTVVMVTHDVDEAVYLSNRVCVMSRRPGRFVQEFPIELDRSLPRERLATSDSYVATRNAVWLSVREQAAPNH